MHIHWRNGARSNKIKLQERENEETRIPYEGKDSYFLLIMFHRDYTSNILTGFFKFQYVHNSSFVYIGTEMLIARKKKNNEKKLTFPKSFFSA